MSPVAIFAVVFSVGCLICFGCLFFCWMRWGRYGL